MAKLTINDLELQGKRLLIRVDYNVPMSEQDGVMVINDDTRNRPLDGPAGRKPGEEQHGVPRGGERFR